jgi:hypothetical protein
MEKETKEIRRCELCGLPWNRCEGHGRGTDESKPKGTGSPFEKFMQAKAQRLREEAKK